MHLGNRSRGLDLPVPVLETLEHRPIGTNGYVSTWGAITSICPPQLG
ncbi:hypothetical protein [Nocardia barduliensis]|nr:hypothetical protein [Nocardia barduliensis]